MLVKWKGYDEQTWEFKHEMPNASEVFETYNLKYGQKSRADSVCVYQFDMDRQSSAQTYVLFKDTNGKFGPVCMDIEQTEIESECPCASDTLCLSSRLCACLPDAQCAS